MRSIEAANAYRKSASHRSPRDQEADLFRQVNAGLREASEKGGMPLAKALSDNERLWIVVMDLVRDPSNQIATQTCAGILSIGHVVRRETTATAPNLAFLIEMNDQLAAGLRGE